MDTTQETIRCMRAFNRFYTVRLGFLDQDYLGTGYSITEMRILYEISDYPNINAKTLSDHLRMDKSYISRVIRTMEGRGLLQRQVSAADRRSYDLRLTPEGRETIARLIQATSADMETILAPLGPQEQEGLRRAMTNIMHILSQGKEQTP